VYITFASVLWRAVLAINNHSLAWISGLFHRSRGWHDAACRYILKHRCGYVYPDICAPLLKSEIDESRGRALSCTT
jgi:hypothetical protein